MIKYLVIGDPISHSRSPGMQNAAFEFHHLVGPMTAPGAPRRSGPPSQENSATRTERFNLTVPHKAEIIPCLDEIDPAAELAGSVNTVTVSEGRLIGTSTDGYGLETALRENFRRPLEGACCCFIGCGGAAHATAFHLAGCGVRAIRIANRTLEKADELAGVSTASTRN